MGMIAKLVETVGLAQEIDSSLQLLKLHKPYHESDHVLNIASAPRGALTYPPHSGEGLEVVSLGPMVYLASKEKGDNSMPLSRLSCPGVWDEEAADPRDTAKA